jgi:hypothetical protein
LAGEDFNKRVVGRQRECPSVSIVIFQLPHDRMNAVGPNVEYNAGVQNLNLED